MTFSVADLPHGMTLEVDTGIVRGIAPDEAGSIELALTIENAEGSASQTVELCVGDRLALTPPMGWNSWNVFGKEVSAEIVMRVADGMVNSGMRDLGYSYINIDDHWHAASRGIGGVPVADLEKFPDGIAAVADYVHERGLKLGMYSDAAEKTCGGCFGGLDHERIDAEHYARWGVDLLKYDYCFAPRDQRTAIERYSTMANAIAECGRSIVFSVCEWGFRRPWEWAPEAGASLWRTTPDIFDSYSWAWWGVRGIARRNLALAEYAGPGQWNDPDMLVVGNRGRAGVASSLGVARGPRIPLRGLNDAQSKSHMSLWAMMAAPLLTSTDPEKIDEFDGNLLTSPEILSINQDPLGQQGRLVSKRRGVWILRKPLTGGRVAISFSNMWGRKTTSRLRLSSVGLVQPLRVTDAWDGQVSTGCAELEMHLGPFESRVFVVGPAT